ncbi:MAG: hypothetical protein IJ692_03905 [Alloprevotella sp.]|nr:hypothetical protein [Alloprevotella sp.]
MNKTLKFACLGAIALAGFGFTACSSSDEVETNPNYNPVTSEVAADFVFSVATSNTPASRMTAANTQAELTNMFRGISDAVLMSTIQKTGTTLNDGRHIWDATTMGKEYSLGAIMENDEISQAPTSDKTKSHRVIELSLPTESNTLLFYGKAPKTASSDQQGAIDMHVEKNLSNIYFTLQKRVKDGDEQALFTLYEDFLEEVLNGIVNYQKAVSVSFGSESYSGTLGWKDYVEVDFTSVPGKPKLQPKSSSPIDPTKDLSPLGEILANAFVSFNTIYQDEVRAGSGPTVAKMLCDLSKVVRTVSNATATSKAEAVAKQVAVDLLAKLTNTINESVNTWVDISTVKSTWGLDDTNTDTYNDVTQNLSDFPTVVSHVPNGATTLQFTIGGTAAAPTYTYSYAPTIPTYAMSGAPGANFDVLNYRYPAELCYFGNSPIRVSTDTHTTSDYPDGVANWDNDDSWAAGATGAGSAAWQKDWHVLSSTRSVAMRDNINYGTAMLKTTVQYGSATLKDNNAAIQLRTGAVESDNVLTVGASSFIITGILIGGVEETVGWDYLPKAATPAYNSFIYDSNIASSAIPAYGYGASLPNYTLTWDNWNPAHPGADQNVVYIALELVNRTGKDFWGQKNLIHNGQTFYLTAKLNPNEGYSATDRGEGIMWPTHYALPPYNTTNGATLKERRVFIQDYVTTANLTIGENSLKYALVTVPDLRSTEISLGLSVDLQWQNGLTFDSTLGGE